MPSRTHTIAIDIRNPDTDKKGVDWKFNLRVEIAATALIREPDLVFDDPTTRLAGHRLFPLEIAAGKNAKTKFKVQLDAPGEIQFWYGPEAFFENGSTEHGHLASGLVKLKSAGHTHLLELMAPLASPTVVESPRAERERSETTRKDELELYGKVVKHFKDLKSAYEGEKGHSVFWESKKEFEKAMSVLDDLVKMKQTRPVAFAKWLALLTKDQQAGLFSLLLVTWNHLKHANASGKRMENLNEKLHAVLKAKVETVIGGVVTHSGANLVDEFDAYVASVEPKAKDIPFDQLIERMRIFLLALETFAKQPITTE